VADILHQLAARVAIPGLPDWVGLVVLLVLGLTVLAFLAMPFSVFGLKARLDQIEAQLDEIHAEIRGLALRHGDGMSRRPPVVDDEWAEPPPVRVADPPPLRAKPPVPPPAAWPDGRGRMEPRL